VDFLPAELRRILDGAPELKRAFLVGGCVRDFLLHQSVKDYDIEVFDMDFEGLANGLARWGRTDLVGRSFGVVKLTTPQGACYDFSIPRRDSKVSAGHQGFEIEFDSSISLEEAAARRDFTINALMWDPRADEILDFFGGANDLRDRVLRHTSSAFVEDPLRVLRGMQFCGRFDLRAASETLALCRSIQHTHSELAVERIREEWFKWAERSIAPSAGLRFLAQTEWIGHYPEIRALIGTPQEPEWHPEGDVFTHTCHCCDALANLPQWQQSDPQSRIVFMLAILAHDFGKPETTRRELKNGVLRITSPGHEAAGKTKAEHFLNRINAPIAVRQRVLPLVANHLFTFQQLTDTAVRRLARRLAPETIDGLCLIITADSMGRPPRPKTIPGTVERLKEKAHELHVRQSPPLPILMGCHLIEKGIVPGPAFRQILDAAYDAQLEGKITDLASAQTWLAQWKKQ
jgi:tRNA nucleotidyltransferase (CCA-adding enzyme)